MSPLRPRGAASRGFTLLEILLVVAIVGIMAGLATMSIGGADFDEKLERETRKIAAQISLLQDESIVQSRELGVGLWQNGYRFWAWDKEAGWQPLGGDDHFKPHLVLEDAEINLSLTGQPVPLEVVPIKGFPAPKTKRRSNTRATANTAPDFHENLPPIVLFSSGEASPFEITLQHPDSYTLWKVSGDIIGTLKISSEVVE